VTQSCHVPWPFDAGSLDVVLASNVLEHLTRDELDRSVEQMLRVLRPGGRVVVIQPNYRYAYREYFDDYTHVAVFSHVSLADYFVSRSFKPVRVEPRFLPFSMKSRVPKSRRLVDWYLRSPVRPSAKQMLVVMEKP
jgi:SAM-dependent methyltransferase